MPQRTFGDELRRMRRASGKTLADLADVLGCSIAFVSDIERGRKNPPPPHGVRKLLSALGQEEQLSNMLTLAAKTRRSIEIPVSGHNPAVTSLLVALQRRCDEGGLDEGTVNKIRAILEEEKSK